MTREDLEQWFDDEIAEIEFDFKEGRITEKQYNFYIANIEAQYKEDLAEFKKFGN